MIFPTDRVRKLRGELEDRVSAGELDEFDAYREALAADPEDPRALRPLALLSADQGDSAAAREFAFRWLRADPLSHEVFRLIGRLLSANPEEAALGAAYLALGNQKLHFDPEADDAPAGADRPAADEPAAVSAELEPHRLLHELWIATTSDVDRDVIDRILARGPEMAPLLLGVLNLYGEDLLDEVDDALLARALALLGEIGDPAALPALGSFLPLEDETLGSAAGWAFQRIAWRKPAEAVAAVRGMIPSAEPIDLASYAQQICLMPDTPGRRDALLEIEGRLPGLEGMDKGVVGLGLITAAMVMDGPESEYAAALESRYAASFPAEARRELKNVRKQIQASGPIAPEEDQLSIHEICCPGFDAIDENEPVVRRPKIGRNDPCWCGSGQKYKKCHLAADEGR